MSVYIQTAISVAVDTMELNGWANALSLSASAEEKDITTLASGGWRAKMAGLAEFTAAVSGFQDYAATGVDVTFPVSGVGGSNVYTIGPTGGAAVADPAFMGQGILTGYKPLSGSVGEPGAFAFDFTGNGRLVRGQYLHPNAARTASGSGTAAAFTTPTATQSLWATFHVLSVTGTGTITFTIQTDDGVGFGTPTTRITSTAFAAVGKQMTSLAGALATETHIRAAWVIAGFTSCTFIVAAGVALTSSI